MSLEELIKEGEALRDKAEPDSWGINKILKGEDLVLWASKCVLFVDELNRTEFIANKVKDNSKDLTKDGYEKCLAILGAIKALNEFIK